MSVTVQIHPFLRKFTAGQKIVEVECRTVGECIENLGVKFPGIKQHLYDNEEKLHNLWDIYVNSVSCYPEELAKLVKNGDELIIVALMHGG